MLEGPNVIGSDRGSHVVLDTEGISRRHAILDVESPHLRLVDQESKNGTWVNGSRVSTARLRLGDEITLGVAKLCLQAVEPDDLDLALSLAEGDRNEEEPEPTADETTTVGQRSANRLLDHWLSLSRSFLDRLDGTADRGVGALGVLTDRLGARGACFAEVRDPGEPAIIALFGQVEPDLLGCSAGRCWSRSRGAMAARELFFTNPDVTGLLLEPEQRALALFVIGDFPGRSASRPLLSTLLHQYLRSARDSGSSATRAPRSDQILRWPPGFIRCLSKPMENLYDAMRPLAASDLPILITGETGTGKELVARALHLSSPRSATSPFVAINCAAIPADLLEAELFGIGSGVASGVSARIGRFAAAADGTLFLDEVSSMPAQLQSKLLRVLQEREIHPLGAAPVPLRARLVAATNVAAPELLAGGDFRSDLFYRLAGATLLVPPLRQRRSDIPMLVDGLLRSISSELGKELRGVSVAAMNHLAAYDWPGNIRELEHELRRLAHFCPAGQPIVSTMLAEQMRRQESGTAPGGDRSCTEPRAATGAAVAGAGSASPAALPTLELSALEALAVRQAMEQAGGKQQQAARLLGISRFALGRRLRKQGSQES